MEARLSFSAADILPLKLLRNYPLLKSLASGIVPPIHLQLNPTNRCNFHCDFCSCANRDKTLELDARRLDRFMVNMAALGCQAVTVTGGGEPMLYKGFSRLLKTCREKNIGVGLVTNGSMFRKEDLSGLTWCRVSCSDELPRQVRDVDAWFKNMHGVVGANRGVDWAFSYVLTASPDWDILRSVVRFANHHNFTHIRIVSDLLDLKAVPDMATIRMTLKAGGVDDSKVIYQGRKHYTAGQNPCYISLLKPVVAAGGGVYPCCGVQYALDDPSLDYEPRMKMCDIEDFPRLYATQKFFDGSICKRCYYSEYIRLLGLLRGDIRHGAFV